VSVETPEKEALVTFSFRAPKSLVAKFDEAAQADYRSRSAELRRLMFERVCGRTNGSGS
jgi:hypothetical protein